MEGGDGGDDGDGGGGGHSVGRQKSERYARTKLEISKFKELLFTSDLEHLRGQAKVAS